MFLHLWNALGRYFGEVLEARERFERNLEAPKRRPAGKVGRTEAQEPKLVLPLALRRLPRSIIPNTVNFVCFRLAVHCGIGRGLTRGLMPLQ